MSAFALAICLSNCSDEQPPDAPVGDAATGDERRRSYPSSAVPRADSGVSDAAAVTTTSSPRPPPPPLRSPLCLQALAEPLPARIAVMSDDVPSTSNAIVVTPDNIDGKLLVHCTTSKCHGGAAFGGWQVAGPNDLRTPFLDFATKAEAALWHIKAEGNEPGPDNAMPPMGSDEYKPWPARVEGHDDVWLMANWLESWIASGYPAKFNWTDEPSAAVATVNGDAGVRPYAMSPAVGSGLTNLGNCIPNEALVGSEAKKSAALDAMFAGLSKAPRGTGTSAEQLGLPKHLSDTDLTTFDGQELASMGVIAFVPAYPLWSDDAGKLRHVRVPRGTSIRFNKATQEFDIPPNTRFYKTFLKRIIDTDGNPSWRKIETRIIVSRPDPAAPLLTPELDSSKINALFGTYVWNDDETDAVLLDTQLHDGEGFPDAVPVYDTDVNLAANIREQFKGYSADRIKRELEAQHAVRHYAVPGSRRCIQCHMGSPSKSFILGFRPVEIKHPPAGAGGVIEPFGPDELTQLERLIAYGVVTGVDTPSDILPLESSQGTRRPRNRYELEAQGYLLGNCAHCHNPRGYPTVTFHELDKVLDFLPSAEGGIFEFPLDRMSPRIQHGIAGDIAIPYITPSLVDHPSYPPDLVIDFGTGGLSANSPNSPNNQDKADLTWLPKWVDPLKIEDHPQTPAFIYAPWRSLVYRNVDTPFSYTDDYAIYPHMPMNTPGFDCRAKQILGDWMVSVPALFKRSDLLEYQTPYPFLVPATTVDGGAPALDGGTSDSASPPSLVKNGYDTGGWISFGDDSPQPYVEVLPGDPQYAAAQALAQQRLTTFHEGHRPSEALGGPGFEDYKGRYRACPDTSDIVDRTVDGVCKLIPVEAETPLINVPTNPHWQTLDLTQSQGDWTPRRSDWKEVLASGQVPEPGKTCDRAKPNTASQQGAVDLLQNVTLDLAGAIPECPPDQPGCTFRVYATHEVPMGLWKDKPTCDWSKAPRSKVKTLAEVRASDPRPWMKSANGSDDTRRVYMQSPGAAVFNAICINCHGPKFDSVGRLADNLATITGGNAQPADLRDGLFGPPGDPGRNRASERVFGSVATPAVTADDWGARYLAWMGLGGTRAKIPGPFIVNVAHTLILGESRASVPPAASNDANMLTVAQGLCRATLLAPPFDSKTRAGYFDNGLRTARKSALIWDNGDAEMWLKLCSANNPPPVIPFIYNDKDKDYRLLAELFDNNTSNQTANNGNFTGLRVPHVLKRRVFESGQPVGDPNGVVAASLTQHNLHPWCVLASGSAPANLCVGGAHCSQGTCPVATANDTECVALPHCPVSLPASGSSPEQVAALGFEGFDGDVDPGAKPSMSEADAWALRGAINAGLAVFLYLDGVSKGTITRQPAYDHCDELQ